MIGGAFGRQAAARDARVPQLRAFLPDGARAPAGQAVRWGDAVAAWPACLNLTLGTCTLAGIAHAKQLFGVIGGVGDRIMTDTEVEGAYRRFGYVPGDPATDRGAVEEDVLTAWHRDGFVIAGAVDRIDAFASIRPADTDGVMLALGAFGAVYLGAILPAYIRDQAGVWHVPAAPAAAALAPIGGHCMLVVDAEPPSAGPDACLTVITWGMRQRITWGWWLACCEEAHVIDHPDWTRPGSRSGIDRAALRAAMAALAA